MPAVDFDFQRYVARRKGLRAAQVREGAAYAYPGDVRVLRTLDKLHPVQLALDEAGRLWRQLARAELLGPTVRATAERYTEVANAVKKCAAILHIDPPAVYIAPQPVGIYTLGTDEDAYIVLAQGMLDNLRDAALLDVLGRECGRIQNGHVPFRTALHYLKHARNTLVRWAVRPATLTLQAWSRRADITADRAGLLCARDLDVALANLGQLAQHSDETQGSREIGRRQRALSRFAGSTYYRSIVDGGKRDDEAGESVEDCDAAVAAILDDKNL